MRSEEGALTQQAAGSSSESDGAGGLHGLPGATRTAIALWSGSGAPRAPASCVKCPEGATGSLAEFSAARAVPAGH